MARSPIVVGRIRPKHLTGRSLWTLYRGARSRSAYPADAASMLLWWAAAHAARRRDDPCAAWLAIVVARDWRAITDEDEDGARLELRALLGRGAPPAAQVVDDRPVESLGNVLDTVLPHLARRRG